MKNSSSRRKFIQQTTLAGAGLILADPITLFSKTNTNKKMKNIKSRGYAAKDASGRLSPWEFERRPVGDNDILIDIKYASICHSDIHQMKNHWAPQQFPQVPGHEIAGIVTAVGKNVTKFKVGDKAGVGCAVDSCMQCESCLHGEEQHCDRNQTLVTYGGKDATSPTGKTEGGYANNLVVRDHFAVHIPDSLSLQDAAPLLCAGITTYSPLMNADIKRGDQVGIAGIGGLGHMAIKLAVSKGADVFAFTTTADKVKDALAFGAKEVIVVDDIKKLDAYKGKLDYLISTIPYKFDVAAYSTLVKKFGHMTLLGMPVQFENSINNIILAGSRVNINSSNTGGIPETQEVINYCADNKILPSIKVIKATEINDAWEKVVNKEARYRYVIDAGTF
jgi:uncharacterized zinc-type alcohol dehydrogenase-like protein